MGTGKLRIGQLVWSTQGRDAGRYYLVTGFTGDRVLVADGEVRTVNRPKKKNIRHLKALPVVDEEISSKVAAGRKLSDADIRKALRSLVEEGSQ